MFQGKKPNFPGTGPRQDGVVAKSRPGVPAPGGPATSSFVVTPEYLRGIMQESRFPVAYLTSLRTERLFQSLTLFIDNARETGASSLVIGETSISTPAGPVTLLSFDDNGRGFNFHEMSL